MKATRTLMHAHLLHVFLFISNSLF